MHPAHLKTLKEVGESLKLAREQSRISLRTLSTLTGVSKGNLSKIEHGGNVTVLTLYRICWALGIHPRYVLPDFKR